MLCEFMFSPDLRQKGVLCCSRKQVLQRRSVRNRPVRVIAEICLHSRYPVFHVIFPSDLVKYAVVNLPLLPLAPWSPPERKRGAESAEKQGEGDEKRQKTEPSL